MATQTAFKANVLEVHYIRPADKTHSYFCEVSPDELYTLKETLKCSPFHSLGPLIIEPGPSLDAIPDHILRLIRGHASKATQESSQAPGVMISICVCTSAAIPSQTTKIIHPEGVSDA